MNQARPYTSSAVAGCAHSQDAASRYSSLEHVVREGLAFARLKGMGATMDREVSLHSLSTHSRAITGSHISSCELCLSRADKPCCLSSMAWTSSHLSCHLFPEDFKDLGCWVMRESGACPAWCSDRQLDLPAPWWQTNRQGRGIRAGAEATALLPTGCLSWCASLHAGHVGPFTCCEMVHAFTDTAKGTSHSKI